MDELTNVTDELTESLAANPSSLAYDQLFNSAGMSTSERVVAAALCVWTIVCRWKMFQKAGLPGWGAIIPFYNIYLRFKMAGMSGWWVLSLLIAPVFAIAFIVSYFKLPGKFGKHRAWGFGLWFLNPIFIGIFAFDKSKYSK